MTAKQKLYQPETTGGICVRSGRKIGEVRIPNYVYDLWLPLIGVDAIGVYGVYCRLERQNVVKRITMKDIARACRIGDKKLNEINALLAVCGFIEVRKPTGVYRARHFTTEIVTLNPPRQIASVLIQKYQIGSGYTPLTSWLVDDGSEALPSASHEALPSASMEAPSSASTLVATLSLQPSMLQPVSNAHARTLLEISEDISPSESQPATPDQIDPQPIVTEKESDLSADATTPLTPSSAAPLSPPAEKWCKACKRSHPVADFIEPGTARQFDVCNTVRAERAAKRKQDAEIKRAVAEKIAADDAVNPPPLEVVRNHPLWVAYRDAIIDASAKLHGMTDALDLYPSKSQTDRYVAILDKLQAQGVTPGAMVAFVHQRMAEHSRRKDKPPVYPFLWLDTDAPQLKFVKVVTLRNGSAPLLDWSTADGCIAIAENAQNAPETRVKALNKLRAYMTPWDVDSAQIERISAMLSRVSHGDLKQGMAA